MKKTTLSLAISLALWGGVPAAYAQQQSAQLPEPQQQQIPQPTGECQQPQSSGECQQPPQPGGSGQQQPPQPGEGGQQQPPQPGEGGQQQPPQPGEGGQQQPPQPGEGGQQQPPQPGEGGQQQPPQPGGNGQHGKPLTFSPKPIKSLPKRFKLPPLPDFSQGLASNGQVPSGKTNVLDGLNQGLAQAGFPQFTFQQREDGPLNVKGSGAAKGIKFAFIAEANRMTQEDENAPIGLTMDEKSGQYAITTPDRQKIPFIPAPDNPTCVLDATGEQGSVEMGEEGDVLLKRPGQQRANVVGIFNPAVAQQSDMAPGIHFMNTAEGEEEAMVACEDGSLQQMRPTVMSPNQFIEKGQQIDGVENITHRKDDGTFDVTFNGHSFKLKPTFDVEAEPLADGEEVEPEISIKPNLRLEYTIQNGREKLRFKLKIR